MASSKIREHSLPVSQSWWDCGVRDLVVLFLHLLATVARLAGPGGTRSVVAESVLSSSTNCRSTLHRLSLVCPMNDSQEGPVPPGAGR
jgi:hypothetical protein